VLYKEWRMRCMWSIVTRECVGTDLGVIGEIAAKRLRKVGPHGRMMLGWLGIQVPGPD
jgi:hypothetical protein